jgi:hypothetical protein
VCPAADLRIRVGNGVWARLEVQGPDGQWHQPADSIRDRTAGARTRYVHSFIIQSECRLDVPPGAYRVVGERGPEFERVEKAVTVHADSPNELNLRIPRWIDMRALGWYSGDMHVHRPLQDLEALAEAENLDFTVAITMWNRRTLWEGKQLPQRGIERRSNGRFISVLNAEDERGGGAWMFHDIPQPLDLASMLQPGQRQTESWFPPGLRFIEQVGQWRRSGQVLPWFEVEKPIWWEAPVVMALAEPDSLGLLNNHFNQYGMLDNEAWGRPRDLQKYPGLAGFAAYTLDLNYRYWNLGFKTPPTAGSASGVLPNPVGYNRIYAPVTGDFTADKWYRAIQSNRHFVTNGPMLFFKANRQGRGQIEVRTREAIDRIELLGNGKVIQTWNAPSAGNTLRVSFAADTRKLTWLAARCFVKNSETVRLAHSSPVFVNGTYDASEDAQYVANWIEELIRNTTAARSGGEAQRDELLDRYRRAAAFYRARIGQRLER